MVESPTALIKRLLRTPVTMAEMTRLVTKRYNFDLLRTNRPMTAQKVNIGSKKVVAVLVTMVRPVCTFAEVIVKVKKMPRMAMPSTAEASTSGDGFKFIKTRLIDEFAN